MTRQYKGMQEELLSRVSNEINEMNFFVYFVVKCWVFEDQQA
jgi:hypothetical protein